MKDTFFKLSAEKKERVLDAVLEEFSRTGFEKTSLDAIIMRAGISKGGLYEYIESKEDLFGFALEYAYEQMFGYITDHITPQLLPSDAVERTRSIATIAVDFFLEKPFLISFLARSSRLDHPVVSHLAEQAFTRYFNRLYEGSDFSAMQYSPDKVISLLGWLLVKTRNDFIANMPTGSEGDREACKDAYLAEWDFFLGVLSTGLYRTGRNDG